jgi:hypothetical protein
MTCVSRFKCSELVARLSAADLRRRRLVARYHPGTALGRLVARHMGNASLRGVFPGYDPKFLGLV